MLQSLRGMAVPERNRGAGLGLGLHIVRHIAALHGGEVTAENAGTDEVVFRVTLPRSRAAA